MEIRATPSAWWQLKLQTTDIVDKHDTMEPICFKIGISLIINVCLKFKSEVIIYIYVTINSELKMKQRFPSLNVLVTSICRLKFCFSCNKTPDAGAMPSRASACDWILFLMYCDSRCLLHSIVNLYKKFELYTLNDAQYLEK